MRGKKTNTLQPRSGGLRQAVMSSRTETTTRTKLRGMLVGLQRSARAEQVQKLIDEFNKSYFFNKERQTWQMSGNHSGSHLSEMRKAWELHESNAIYTNYNGGYTRYPGTIYAYLAEIYANSDEHSDKAIANLEIGLAAQERHIEKINQCLEKPRSSEAVSIWKSYGLRESSQRTDESRRLKVLETAEGHLKRMQMMHQQLLNGDLPDAGNVFKSINNSQLMRGKVIDLFYELVDNKKPAEALEMYQMYLNATEDVSSIYRARNYQTKQEKLDRVSQFSPDLIAAAAKISNQKVRHHGTLRSAPESLDLELVRKLKAQYSLKGTDGLKKLGTMGYKAESLYDVIPVAETFSQAQNAWRAIHRAPMYYHGDGGKNVSYKVPATKAAIDEMLEKYPDATLTFTARGTTIMGSNYRSRNQKGYTLTLEARIRIEENDQTYDLVLVRNYSDSTCRSVENAINKDVPLSERAMVQKAQKDISGTRFGASTIGARTETVSTERVYTTGNIENYIGKDDCKHPDPAWHPVFNNRGLGYKDNILYYKCCPDCLHPRLDSTPRHTIDGLDPLSDFSRNNYVKEYNEMAIANDLPGVLAHELDKAKKHQGKIAPKQTRRFWQQ